jgi:hypothetical protein
VRRPEVSRPRRTDRGSTVEAGPRTSRPPAAGRPAAPPRTRIKLPADPYAEEAPRGLGLRLRGPLIGLGLVLVLFAVIALVNRGHGRAAGKPAADAGAPATPSAAATASAGPVTAPFTAGLAAGSADGVPVGYPHTTAGAESAAANYVVAFYSANMVSPGMRRQLVNAIADPAIANALLGQFDATFSAIDTDNGLSASGAPPAGQTFVMRTSPMGVSLVSQNGPSVTVAVWVVSLAGVAGTNTQHPVQENWATITATLNWTHGDWKWYSVAVSDGPAPLGGLQTPAPGQTLQAAVTKFGGLKYAR